jgi:hypothetical protein
MLQIAATASQSIQLPRPAKETDFGDGVAVTSNAVEQFA